MPTAHIEIPGPFALDLTTRGLGVGRWSSNAWWWATHTSSGPATIRLEADARTVVATTWGHGADDLIDRLPSLVGHDDAGRDAGTWDELKDLAANTIGLRLGSNRAAYETVATTVIGQLVTTKEAKSSLRRLSAALGGSAPGPNADLLMFPSSHVLARLSYEELHRFGIERKRAATLVEVARRAGRIEEILTMARADAEARLLAVRGVGPWTVGAAMGAAWGDADAVPIGDFHLPNTVAWALAREPRADDDRMLELLEPYRPHRRRVLLMIKFSGIRAPRYGPKSPTRDHL